jgi:chondroitin AC lyase
MKKCLPGFWAICLAITIASPGRGDDNQIVGQRLLSGLFASTPGTATVESDLSSLTPSGSWSDINYSSTAITNWSPSTHLSRLQAMCQDYENPACSLYHNASLGAGISSAYNYWVTVDPQSGNWYDNQIRVPQDMGNILLLIESGTNASSIVSASGLASGENEINQAYVPRSNNSGTNTGENRVNRALACIDLGVLTSSSTLTSVSFGAISDTLAITASDGIQPDYSFHQHGPQLYGGGYGMEFGGDVASACLLGASTSFAFSTSSQQTLVNYLVNAQQWFCRGVSYDYTAMGRYITFTGMNKTALSLIPAVQDMLQASTYDQSQLQSMLTCLQTASSTGVATPSLALSGNRSFFSSDFMVNQRPAWYASVKTSSVRTSQPETGNGQGLQSLYLGSGVTQIEVTGNEYANIFPVWNWRRLPGTTVEQNNVSLQPASSWGVPGTATYSGGVSNNTYGCEAFSYSQGNVSALKSWFYFDNEFVALGAGINAPNATSPVITTLNQCLLTSSVTYATTSGGTQTLSSGTANSGNLSWVYQGGVGYLFPSSPSSATILAIAQSGTWYSINTAASQSTVTSNVFSLQINHPSQPAGATYSYIVVPGTTAAGMAAYAANNPITILRNDTTVQAVENASLGLTEAAFYTSGQLNIAPAQNFWVTPNAPALLLLQQSNSGLTITASNPLAAALALQVEVGLPLANTWNPIAGYSTVTLNLSGGSLGGLSATQFFPYPLTWDTTAGSGGGWQAGSGTWSNSPSQMSWTTSPTGTNALSWTDSASANFSASGPSSIAVQGAVNVNNITVSGTGYSFSGGTLNVLGSIQSAVNANIASALTLPAAGLSVSSGSGQALTIAGKITGSGGLIKNGSNYGTLILSGSNTFTGNVTVNNGALEITNGSALGTGPKTVTADLGTNGNCQIVLDGSGGNINIPSNITFVTSNQSTNGTVFNDGGNNTISGSFTLASGGGASWIVSNSGSLTLAGNLMPSTTGRYLYLSGPANGVISGRVLNGTGNNVLGLQVMGPGTWTLTGSNTYSAGTKIEGGTLDINADAALGAGTSAVTFSAVGALQATGTVTLNPSRPIIIGSGATATLDTQAGKMTVMGAISGTGGAVMKQGSGTLVLSGSNSYTGGTIVEAGTLVVTAAGALPAGTSLTIGAGATSFFAPAVPGPSLADSPAIAAPASPTASAEPVPEPGTWALLIAAVCCASAYPIATLYRVQPFGPWRTSARMTAR